jgi:hypothetical protein
MQMLILILILMLIRRTLFEKGSWRSRKKRKQSTMTAGWSFFDLVF